MRFLTFTILALGSFAFANMASDDMSSSYTPHITQSEAPKTLVRFRKSKNAVVKRADEKTEYMYVYSVMALISFLSSGGSKAIPDTYTSTSLQTILFNTSIPIYRILS